MPSAITAFCYHYDNQLDEREVKDVTASDTVLLWNVHTSRIPAEGRHRRRRTLEQLISSLWCESAVTLGPDSSLIKSNFSEPLNIVLVWSDMYV